MKGPFMNTLAEKLLAQTDSKFARPLSESFIMDRAAVFYDTHIPMVNLALSGYVNKGLPTGITTIAAPPKHFKSLFGLHAVEAFQLANPNGIVLFYDTEFGINKEYLARFKLNLKNIIHIPVTTLEELRHEMSKQLGVLYAEFQKSGKKNDKVVIFLDSLGNLASNKETEDAQDGKTTADMTRAKVIKSIFRIVTTKVNILDIPMVVINHTYDSMDLFSKPIVSGGSGIQYASANILTITKAQQKDKDNEISGYKFTLVPLMSRYVKEKTKLPIYVFDDQGIPKYSGLIDFAKDFGIVSQCRVGVKGGWKFVLDGINGEDPAEYKCLTDNIHTDANFWETIFKYTDFTDLLQHKFSIENTDPIEEDVLELVSEIEKASDEINA
jgi:RecA/RadA recombinase